MTSSSKEGSCNIYLAMRSRVSQTKWLENIPTYGAYPTCALTPLCCLFTRQALCEGAGVLEVAASNHVAICVWLAELCFSAAPFYVSIIIGGLNMWL
jgi:hypothetical protein